MRQSQDLALQELVQHIFNPSWREVFLLAVAMSPSADKLVLLMKETIDKSLAKDHKLQEFLQWLNEKTIAVNITYNSQDITKIQSSFDFFVNSNLSLSRTFYLHLYLYRDFPLSRFLDLNFSLNFSLDRAKKIDPELYPKFWRGYSQGLKAYVIRD